MKLDLLDKVGIFLIVVMLLSFFAKLISPAFKKEPITIDLPILKEYPSDSYND